MNFFLSEFHFIVFLNFYNFGWSLEIAFSYDFRGAAMQMN